LTEEGVSATSPARVLYIHGRAGKAALAGGSEEVFRPHGRSS